MLASGGEAHDPVPKSDSRLSLRVSVFFRSSSSDWCAVPGVGSADLTRSLYCGRCAKFGLGILGSPNDLVFLGLQAASIMAQEPPYFEPLYSVPVFLCTSLEYSL